MAKKTNNFKKKARAFEVGVCFSGLLIIVGILLSFVNMMKFAIGEATDVRYNLFTLAFGFNPLNLTQVKTAFVFPLLLIVILAVLALGFGLVGTMKKVKKDVSGVIEVFSGLCSIAAGVLTFLIKTLWVNGQTDPKVKVWLSAQTITVLPITYVIGVLFCIAGALLAFAGVTHAISKK